jgi:phospho-N-acetylmuramoyl-pentapeptide-transferase
MLYHFLYPLSDKISLFNVFKYITLRSFLAFAIGVIITIYIGKKFIAFMQMKQFGQVIRSDGPESHLKKAGTPTMGGVFIIGAIVAAMAICGNFSSGPVVACFMVMGSYFVLGFLDDYFKVLRKNSKGITPKVKLLWQTITALAVGVYLIQNNIIDTTLHVPFLKDGVVDLGWGYLGFIALVLVGSSNAVNLTDGLDGLAIGPIITSAMTLGIIAYITGHFSLSEYLFIPYVEGSGELAVLSAAVTGSGVGFLWYNSYPAEVFMGDVGSLSLGGLLGTMAVVTKSEVLFALIGGVFVFEAISVIIQVISFKWKKKRVFKMAPVHHHFELMGWPEPKVIVRFWIISVFLAILAMATLKLR